MSYIICVLIKFHMYLQNIHKIQYQVVALHYLLLVSS